MTDAAWGTLSNQAVAAAGLVYFLALLAYVVEWASLRQVDRSQVLVGAGGPESEAASDAPDVERARDRVAVFGRLGLLLMCIAVAVHFLALLGRGMSADPNRVPWGNMYEFTLTGTFVVAFFYLVLSRRWPLDWLAPLVVAFVLTLLMVAVLWLYDATGPLPEALNSYWLVIHVVSAILATGAFTLGGMTSVAYLLKRRRPAAAQETGFWGRVPSLEKLDLISYRIHAFAFPVWTFAVLITGPIWAHQAWSSYWNWDPKEVWAFITWVVYAAYLHARTTAGWRGRNAAILALVGTLTLWFNFIGINYFSTSSQHSYAGATAPVSQLHR
jgi:cytochrome c-type biogenesis protein CcsB